MITVEVSELTIMILRFLIWGIIGYLSFNVTHDFITLKTSLKEKFIKSLPSIAALLYIGNELIFHNLTSDYGRLIETMVFVLTFATCVGIYSEISNMRNKNN